MSVGDRQKGNSKEKDVRMSNIVAAKGSRAESGILTDDMN